MGKYRGKKKSADAKGLEVAQARFASVLEGSTIQSVDPRACIPLTRIRQYSRSGILRLKRIFSGQNGLQSRSEVVGFVAGSDCPIVIPMVGTYSRLVVEFFIEKEGLTRDEADSRMQSRNVFYGVVDGMHRILALLELIDEQPQKWDGFSVPVTVLKGGHDVQTLRQLARQQNKKHSQAHYVETTLYDHLRGLKDEVKNLRIAGNGRRPSGREVAEAYDDPSEYKDQTMLQMANTAMRLPDRVVQVLGEIMSSEHPELVEIPPDLAQNLNVGDNESIMANIDCRVYRKFINLTSLKSATAFMKGGSEEAEEAQVNTLYRCREICRSQNFKAVPYRTVVEQYERATQAIKECRKMESLMETDKWPLEMQTLRGNILRSVNFDANLLSNAGNDTHVLSVLLKHYENVCPGVATAKIQKFNSLHTDVDQEDKDVYLPSNGETHGQNGETPAETGEPIADSSDPVTSKETLRKGTGVDEASRKEPKEPDAGSPRKCQKEDMQDFVEHENVRQGYSDEGKAHLCKASEEGLMKGTPVQSSKAASERSGRAGDNMDSAMDMLKVMGISTHQMRWQDYDERVKEGSSEVFDILLTDPPYGLPPNRSKSGTRYEDYVDEKEMKLLAEFARRTLVPGGYVFLFCSHNYFQSWLEAFQNTAFRCMKYPFVIHKDGYSMQRHRNEDFPQNNCEYALIARAPNASSSSFKPDFESPFNYIPCKQKRRFASLITCPVPRSKLTNGQTKAPLLTEEKNPKVLVEVLQTFSREGARVIDCYGGTLTTAVACMMSGRSCCVIEKDPELFGFAMRRLLKMVEINDEQQNGKRRRFCPELYERANDENETGSSTRLVTDEAGKNFDDRDSDVAGSPCNEEVRGGDNVLLTVSNRRVATAKLQQTADSERELTCKIHGYDLSVLAGNGEILVAVLDVSVAEDEIETMYPYCFKSLEDNPRVLGEMVKGGIYAWGLNCVQQRRTGA